MSTPMVFKQTLIVMNLNQHTKNQAFSPLCSRDIVDFKSYNLIGKREFCYIPQEPIFPIYETCARIQQIMLTFIID